VVMRTIPGRLHLPMISFCGTPTTLPRSASCFATRRHKMTPAVRRRSVPSTRPRHTFQQKDYRAVTAPTARGVIKWTSVVKWALHRAPTIARQRGIGESNVRTSDAEAAACQTC
jgi:hypothetical protein